MGQKFYHTHVIALMGMKKKDYALLRWLALTDLRQRYRCNFNCMLF